MITRFMTAILLAITISSGLHAQDTTRFEHGEWAAVLKKAKAANKPVFVDMYFEGCMPCREMDRRTFKDSTVSRYLNENFICYKTDVFKEKDGKMLMRKYGPSGFPHFMIINGDGYLVDQEGGFIGAPRLLPYLQKVNADFKKGKRRKYSNRYDIAYPVFYDSIFTKPSRQVITEEMVNGYLDKQQNLSLEVPFLVMLWHTTRLNEQHRQYFISHFQQLASDYGEALLSMRALNLVDKMSKTFGSTGNEAAFKAMMAQVQPVHDLRRWNIFGKKYYEQYYLAAKAYKQLIVFADTSAFYQDALDKAELITKLAPLVTDAASLQAMDNWLPEGTLSKGPNYQQESLWYLKAILHYYMKDDKNAMAYTEKALSMPTAYNQENVAAFASHMKTRDDKGFVPKMPFVGKPIVLD